MTENAKRITVVEDSTVDRGGCVIETDFGEIDARIASQLHELEERILDVAPIRARGKAQG
jgi:flagellar assembly protein FliH